jgi:iron complex outermembrane receptor protein
MSLARGRTVLTGGLRQDLVGLRVTDRRPGVAANLARVRDGVDELTWHLGVNHQAAPSRLLLFATTSTAFNPSTRVDARTGHIQGNETTFGYEAGGKARLVGGRLDLTAAAFTFVNRDISRRNPLYGDPLQDANHTQPQLVAAGEERFTGGKLEGRWRVTPAVSLSFVGSHVRAVTTASPDLPEEVGRRLSRFPPYNAALSAAYTLPEGRWRGLSLSGSWAYLSDFTAYYADRQRFGLEYAGYGLVHLGASYSLRAANRTHSFGLTVRNALDRDLLASHDRLGAEREFGASYRVTF